MNWNDMLVTINTDASCFQHKYSGYAFYIICNDGKIQKAGMLKDEMDSLEAEYACLCNALYTLLHSQFKGITKVVVNTDCLYAIKTVSGESKKPKDSSRIRRYWDYARKMMREIASKYGVSQNKVMAMFDFRHVKAHSGVDDARSWVNRWCDKEAKKYAKQRQHINK